MTTKEIEALLAKYYEGEASLREEHLLKEFFQGDTIPENLKEHKALFGFFAAEGKATVSPAFESTLKDNLAGGPVINMKPGRKRLVLSLSLAASIVLIASLITVFKMGVFTPSQPYGTISDPQLAYAETRNALMLVSSKLNSGMTQVQHLQTFSTGYDRARQLQSFQLGLDQMNKFNQLDKYQPIKLNPGRPMK